MLKKIDGIVCRKIHDLFYLIDIRCNYYDDKCYLYEINEVGAFLWNNVDEFNTVTSLTKRLLREIIEDVDEKMVEADVEQYINALIDEGFIECQGGICGRN